MSSKSIHVNYLKGYDFQEHVKNLLALSGYLEGQIFSTGVSKDVEYYEKLRKLKKFSYTSPDILIVNKWLEDTPVAEFRFGLCCDRRDKFFDNYGKKSVTFPTYQREAFEKMSKTKSLELYLVFGKKLEKDYAVGVTALRKPDDIRHYTDASTRNVRRNDIYFVKTLARWRDFIGWRCEKDDREPNLENLYDVEIPWIGDY